MHMISYYTNYVLHTHPSIYTSTYKHMLHSIHQHIYTQYTPEQDMYHHCMHTRACGCIPYLMEHLSSVVIIINCKFMVYSWQHMNPYTDSIQRNFLFLLPTLLLYFQFICMQIYHHLIATTTTSTSTYIYHHHRPPPCSASCSSASGVCAPVGGRKKTTSASCNG